MYKKESFENFLEVYPHIRECALHLIHDSDKDNNPKKPIFHLSDTGWDTLKEYADKGYASFFSVNSMEKGKRSKSAVTRINAWVAEIDHLSKEEQLVKIAKAPLKPNMIIESKNSYHMYWFAFNGTKENFLKIGSGLHEYFGGDSAVSKDMARVLRLPGLPHQKDPNKPFVVDFFLDTDYFQGGEYTEKQMMKAYPYEEKVIPKIKKIEAKADDDIRDIMERVDTMMMLQRISSTSLVNGEHIDFKKNSKGYQIVCNGKETGCFLDEDNRIGSSDEGGPTWIQWVGRYGNKDKKELRRWFLDNCQDLLPSGWKEPTAKIVKPKIEEVRSKFEKTKYTRGIKYMPPKMPVFDKKDFVILAGYPGSGKTQFTYFLAQQNASFGMKTVYVSLEMSPTKMIDMLARKKAGIEKYRADRGLVRPEQEKVYKEEYKRLQTIPNLEIFGYDESPTIEVFSETVEDYVNKGYGLIFVDNLGYFRGKGRELDVHHDVTQKCRSLVNKHDICIIMLHHMNKPTRKTGIQKPGGIGGIRGSQKVIDNATLVYEIRRDQEEGGNLVNLIKLKDTHEGYLCRADLKFDKGSYSIYHEPDLWEKTEKYLD